MTRTQIIKKLDEISETIEKLNQWREGFLDHLEGIEFELEDLKEMRHYLVEELLSKPIYPNLPEVTNDEE